MKILYVVLGITLIAAYGCGSGEYSYTVKEPVSIKAVQNKNKALVVYYTRTGNTRVAAETIRETLDADLQEIRDEKDRSGITGFISGMIDVKKKNPTADTRPKSIDLKAYDFIVICSPTWGMKFAPAITAFMESADFKNKKVFFVAVATAKMKNETFAALGSTIASKGGQAVGSMLIKTIFKNPAAIKEETKKLVKETRALQALNTVN